MQPFPHNGQIHNNRDNKRQELLEARRRNSAPVVVGLLPLTAAADAQHVWDGLLAAAGGGGSSSSGSMSTVVAQGRHKVRLTLLKPPADREVGESSSSC